MEINVKSPENWRDWRREGGEYIYMAGKEAANEDAGEERWLNRVKASPEDVRRPRTLPSDNRTGAPARS